MTGPSGAGKELVAHAVHHLSGRSGPLVAVNVCALGDGMFEAAFFGHVRGAFTGALRDSDGFLSEAHRGTLFLDEIGGLSLAAQAKLLRALETRRWRPVGAARDRTADFRVVAATNESLPALVAEGRFRSDLWHRLHGVVISLPSLRERRDDIPRLLEHFARRLRQDLQVVWQPTALSLLCAHPWPGNVRELRHVVHRILALTPSDPSDASLLVESGHVAWALGVGVPSRPSIGPTFARDEMLRLMEDCSWRAAEAALRLQVSRATVYRRLERLGIPTPRLASGRMSARARLRPAVCQPMPD